MSLTLNKPKLDNLAGDIWKSAERLRGKFKAYEYQGTTIYNVVKLFKKTLPLNGSSLSLTIERETECSGVVSNLSVFALSTGEIRN